MDYRKKLRMLEEEWGNLQNRIENLKCEQVGIEKKIDLIRLQISTDKGLVILVIEREVYDLARIFHILKEVRFITIKEYVEVFNILNDLSYIIKFIDY